MSVQFVDASSKPSVSELASFASRAKEIDIGGDDIVELGDDLGVGLLTNQNKVAPSPMRHVNVHSHSQSQSYSESAGHTPHIQIRPVDDLEVVNLDAAPGAGDIRINHDTSAPFVINTSSDLGSGSGSGSGAGSSMSPEQEATEKQRYLTKLRRLESQDIRGARMTMSNSLADIKAEHDRLTDSRNLEASIRFQRNALMTFVTGVEMVNDKFGHRLPMKPRLKGWSESVHTNVEDFDEIFEELYDLYKDQAKMHPLLRLVGTLGVSATMYHLTNTMAERSGVPGMSDLLNENPELQRQFAAAMAAKMGGGLGNFMSAAGGFSGGPIGMPPSPPRAAENTRMPFNVASAAEAPRARREMRGPSGVDDILKAFEMEREQAAAPPIREHHSSVFAPTGLPPTPPRQDMRNGLGTSADPLAEFMMDGGSVGTESTMNSEKRRGRRRAAAAPVGVTLNLNV